MKNINRRDFILAASAATVVASLPTSNATAAGGQAAKGASTLDPMALVDPELRPAIQAMLKTFPLPKIQGEVTPAQLAALRKLGLGGRPPLEQPAVVERSVPGRAGAPDVKVFVINAKPGTRRPAILHMHGGGYVLGSAASSVPGLQVLAQAMDCVIVTVEYRLAPETPFPGSLEDNYAALKWLHANAEELGADRPRIALSGESAGGGHAAMLAIAARDRGEVPVLFQSLQYPMLDDRTASTRKVPAHIGTLLWTAEYNRMGWGALLGKAPGGRDAPAGAVPARLENLAGLAPAWIGVGSLDLFVDEDIEYARRLIDAGVPTELVVAPGAYHGFDALAPTASISKQFKLSRYNALARAFGVKQLEAAPAT
ncbi:MAG TPA: alpha/beta hydrolase [Blastocatellia bacterium]|nr:alpha/beta hydrolase [Blastocatellia bacterium]